ncbi:MAG: ABC transporter permease subunit [Anaerolineae bacterium]|nr:ABC transporter permease subunit [Anaerolineae bacterium]
MNRRAVRALIRRDLQTVLQSKPVLMPMIILPVILVVILPLVIGLAARAADPASPDYADLITLMEQLPPGMMSEFSSLSSMDQAVIYTLIYFFAPLFLILPMMTASVIAADSFAGEKERKTLEALLYTPTSDQELYLAKVLSPWLAAFAVTVLALVGYSIVVNAVAGPLVGHLFFPNGMWLVLTFWVAPAAAGLGLGSMVLVSSRVSTFQEAYQLGSIVVVPILLLLFGQIGGIIYFSIPVVLLVGLVLWLIDLGVLWFGARSFTRSRLFSRL